MNSYGQISIANSTPTGGLFRIDWKVIPADMRKHIVLSGGLNPSNVAAAVSSIRPWAVDVSSGVESIKAEKDHAKIAAFIQQVKQADQDANV